MGERDTNSLSVNEVIRALEALGKRIEGDDEIEILLVGGVAGMLSGQLRADRMTDDCDVMNDEPEGAFDRLKLHAAAVARKMGLNPRWINDDCRIFAKWLPEGWRERRKHVGNFGLLRVYRAD